MLSSRPNGQSSSADPFQLERLAEELVNRELSNETQFQADDLTHDLPTYIPLSHDNPYLTGDSFDVEEFLLSRSHTTSLQELRIELRDYLATLKEELVKLINDDYEAFISLSTDLKGEGVRLQKLKSPLEGLKTEISLSKAELCALQDEIQEKLRKRGIIREEKFQALLQLLLKIAESVTRLESLLLISSPNQDDIDSNELERFRMGTTLAITEVSSDDRSRGSKAKHLSRVASEYTQLLYHTSKASKEKCAYVNEIQWRIDRIQSTLSSDLDHLFSSTLSTLTSETKVLEVERSKLIADLTECLRTYDTLGLWRDAEDILRRDVLRAFVKKTVFPGALNAPHSPLLPHTPMRTFVTPAFLSNVSLLPPRTPYTPFTAFPLQQTASSSGFEKSDSPHANILEQSDEPLAKLFVQILRFLERDLTRIMDIAERVSIKSAQIRSSTAGSIAMSQPIGIQDQGFQILANVVWDELGRAMMDDLGGIVFAAGRPNEFRKNHEITQAFIRSLENLAPSGHAVEAMRSHPVYISFEKRWQLPVYFQMRWKEIVGKVEETLASPQVELCSKIEKDNFVTTQGSAIWVAISACWSAEIYMPELSHRFWRLMLQLLSRYQTWINGVLGSTDSTASAALGGDKASSSVTRSSTPAPTSEATSAENYAADDALLRQYAAVLVDVKVMQKSVLTLWDEEISIVLPEAAESVGNDEPNPRGALQSALLPLSSLTVPMSSNIVSILTKRCQDALLPVRSIPSQFRAMTNKKMPTEPSPFTKTILRPVKVFFGIGNSGNVVGELLKEDNLDLYVSQVFDGVSQKYLNFITNIKNQEESLKRLKRGKKNTFSLFGSSTSREDEGRDEQRIRAQLILDVEVFGKDGQSLGVNLDSCQSYKALNELVNAVEPPDST
ncbi:COG complex component [Dendrothele bispora CBS 962.96]|uniref:Conserved oligomeric Golgi complex subunit 2 n=1 Tax=Dendrothele bispora (strain CBS 962.96) TaxID=1314807 RepID=A0A4S8M0R2_DENBC|nr:COG complex component [Dendrothele bispora CBS 962.96]